MMLSCKVTSPRDGTGDFTYDNNDQLTEVDYDYQADESYAFDTAGNRTMTGYVLGPNNQTLSDGTYNYTYDAEGNRTSKTDIATGTATEYTWDHRNRLTEIVAKDAQQQVLRTVQYRYEPMNRRMAKVVAPAVGPATVEHFIYDGAARQVDDDKQIALRFGTAGTVINRYLHGPAVDQILADEQVDPGTGQVTGVLWPLTDHQGSVRDLAVYDDQTGITTIANHITYGAFGEITSESAPLVDHVFGYTGRETDAESDLYYYRARYYDPHLGQFASEDPLGFDAQDPNLRRYVGNGPMGATDPSGEIVFTATGVAIGIGAVWLWNMMDSYAHAPTDERDMRLVESLDARKQSETAAELVEFGAIIAGATVWRAASPFARAVAARVAGGAGLGSAVTALAVEAAAAGTAHRLTADGVYSVADFGQPGYSDYAHQPVDTLKRFRVDIDGWFVVGGTVKSVAYGVNRFRIPTRSATPSQTLAEELFGLPKQEIVGSRHTGAMKLSPGEIPQWEYVMGPSEEIISRFEVGTHNTAPIVEPGGIVSGSTSVRMMPVEAWSSEARAPKGGVQQRATSTIGDLRAAGQKDAHHVIQDAAVRDLPGYNANAARGVQLPGPSAARGTPHYRATQVQRQSGGGTYAAERRIGYKALQRSGYSEPEARRIIQETDDYFRSLGVEPSTFCCRVTALVYGG